MVADAPQHQFQVAVGVGLDGGFDFTPRLPIFRNVELGRAPAENLGAVVADPDEGIIGQGAVARRWTAEEVAGVAALRQDLDQPARVPEGVEVDRGGRARPKLLGKIAAADQDLAHERLARRHVAIGLQVPAAHDVPFSFFDQALDAGKEFGFIFFDPLIEDDFVVVENEAGELLAQVCGGAEGGEHGGRALFPFPQPDRVEVGIADEVDGSSVHSVIWQLSDSVIGK